MLFFRCLYVALTPIGCSWPVEVHYALIQWTLMVPSLVLLLFTMSTVLKAFFISTRRFVVWSILYVFVFCELNCYVMCNSVRSWIWFSLYPANQGKILLCRQTKMAYAACCMYVKWSSLKLALTQFKQALRLKKVKAITLIISFMAWSALTNTFWRNSVKNYEKNNFS